MLLEDAARGSKVLPISWDKKSDELQDTMRILNGGCRQSAPEEPFHQAWKNSYSGINQRKLPALQQTNKQKIISSVKCYKGYLEWIL